MSDQQQPAPVVPAAGAFETERDFLAQLLQGQQRAVELETYLLDRYAFAEPAIDRVTIGNGKPAEQTIAGDQQEPFAGVFVLNANPVVLQLGFDAGGGLLGIPIPAGSWLQVPQRFVNLSLFVPNPADQQGPNYTVVVMRLRVAPLGAGAGPVGTAYVGAVVDVQDRPARQLGQITPAAGATFTTSPARVATAPISTGVTVAAADTAVLGANPAALERSIVNDSPNLVYLQLGGGAAALHQGVRLNANGGAWSTQTYTGAVRAIATAAGSIVTVTEVA